MNTVESINAEIRSLQDEGNALTKKVGFTSADGKRVDFILGRVATLKDELRTLSTTDADRIQKAHELAKLIKPEERQAAERQLYAKLNAEERKAHDTRELLDYLKNGRAEWRTYSGMDSVTSNVGGFLVPQLFQNELFKGIATQEPLFDEANVRFIRTDTGAKMNVPGIDLSQMSAQLIGQNTDLAPNANPVASTNIFGAYTYRVTPVGISFELEQDAFEPLSEILKEAFSIGFAQGIGADLISGNGTTAPQGILTAATDSTITTASPTAITGDELTSIYFALPRVHRVNPKTAFVMSDAAYQLVRKAKDTAGRPLLNISEDGEKLFGKKVLVSPSMNVKKIVLANLSQYVVRVATQSVRVKRVVDQPGYIDVGMAALSSWMRVDAKLISPASSVSPAIFGTIHS
jgi:HK97 family phage major capsid protein